LKLKSPGAQIFDEEISYKFKIMPKVDQANVFENVSKVLAGGGCVAMFPEGGSHDQSDLLPFKAGIALMAF
jgi:glycerol-3-phosphate O-acyltransferase/dihydroxyacetone phosphate acyltransferase